jgi:hypothetical protein
LQSAPGDIVKCGGFLYEDVPSFAPWRIKIAAVGPDRVETDKSTHGSSDAASCQLDWFYEWQRIGEKTKQQKLRTYRILTTDPNELMEPIHNIGRITSVLVPLTC